MDTITIEATEREPEVNFDFDNNAFALRGESYPENVTEFYGPLMEKLEAHLKGLSGAKVSFTFSFIYFNSSTAKVLMGLFDTLDETAEAGNEVTVVWEHEPDDDNMQEMGEEFAEDLENATFEMREIGA